MTKGLRFLPILAAFLVSASCDEFLLKKTVSLEYVTGELVYQPAKANLSGNMTYTIQNRQDKPLGEVYLICHPSAVIDAISYNGAAYRFEQGIGYGFGIYRIVIPMLPRNSKARIGIRFHLTGPFADKRFVLTDKKAFLDANKIWLPVPFADDPNFGYKITLKTPKEFYGIMSAKMTSETVDRSERTTVWESEIDNALLTGNLYIGTLRRFGNGNFYFYSQTTNNVDTVLSDGDYVWDELNGNVTKPPFSQFHIVNDSFVQRDEGEFIDGEFLANLFLISTNTFSRSYGVTAEEVAADTIPVVPKGTEYSLFETLAHELSHVYTSSILKFEQDENLSMESLTEFLCETLARSKYPALYPKLIERNRVLLRNIYHLGQTGNPLWKYLYGVTALDKAFAGSRPSLAYNYVDILIQKYRYTTVSIFELLQTASSMNQQTLRESGDEVPQSELIDTSFLDLWKNCRLYNVSLSTTYLLETNRYRITTNYSFALSNQFPINVAGLLISYVGTNTFTNLVTLPARSGTNFVFNYPVTSLKFDSACREFERDLSDNIFFLHSAFIPRLVQSINQFYKNNTYDASLVDKFLPDLPADDAGFFTPLPADRESHASSGGPVYFELDDFAWINNELYLYVYRKRAGTILSYSLIKTIKQHGKYIIVGIYDPLE